MYIISLVSCTGLVKCVCIIPILPTRKRELRRRWSSHYNTASRIWELGLSLSSKCSALNLLCVFFKQSCLSRAFCLVCRLCVFFHLLSHFFVSSFSIVYFVYSWPLNNWGWRHCPHHHAVENPNTAVSASKAKNWPRGSKLTQFG